MSQKRRITLGVVCLVGLIAVGIALSAAFEPSWGARLSHWPQVPPPELYVFTQPKPEDVAGVYELTRQTITSNGLAVLEGRPCQLNLRSDGTFTATNYPDWAPDSTNPPSVATFISTTGHWRCDKVNISYNGHGCWGVIFFDAKPPIDQLALRRKGAPYDLMLTYGDGDDGTVMTFGRKK